MQLKKTIVSLLFLFTYLVGFTHNLAPHCGAFNGQIDSDFHQHISLENKNIKHHYITHIDHLDEGFYNYLICVIEKINHSEQKHSIEHQFSFNNNNLSLDDVGQIQFVSVLITFFIPVVQQVAYYQYAKNKQNKVKPYASPLLINSPFRGPPSFSC